MKKFFGILLIIIGSILSFASLVSSLPLIFKSFFSLLRNTDAYSIGSFIGSVIAFLLFMALAVFLIIKGAKWAKSSKIKRTEPVEEY